LFAALLLLLLAACGGNEETGGNESSESTNSGDDSVSLEGVPERFQSGDPIKIMVVRKIGGDDHTAQFLAGTKEEGEALGFQVDTFTANGDTAKFLDTIKQAIDSDY